MQSAIRSSGKSRLGAMMAAFLGMAITADTAFPNWLAKADPVPRIRYSRRYPEQSSRQAMRGARRQQGGKGIVLTSGGVYVAR
jgi:hypothetical protein